MVGDVQAAQEQTDNVITIIISVIHHMPDCMLSRKVSFITDLYGRECTWYVRIFFQITMVERLYTQTGRKRGMNMFPGKALRLPKDPSLMRPIDYSKMSEFTCLFEGRLNELTATL